VRSAVRRGLQILACAGWVLFHAGAQAAAPAGEVRAVALLPVQDRAGDQRAALAVEHALRRELALSTRVLDAEGTRDALRRLRMRNANDAPPEALQRVAGELGADWLVAATLHEAGRRGVPSLTVSVRVYRGAGGELFWAGFRGASGLDSRTVLGLGAIYTVERLAIPVVERLGKDVAQALDAARGPVAAADPAAAALGSVAVVPLAGLTARDATRNAETVTEAVRAALLQVGAASVSPGCTNEVLRRERLVGWGGIDASARLALRDRCGADAILTGSVELYDMGGAENEPEPRAAIALRLVDAATGRIVWTAAQERKGWDHQGLFRVRLRCRGTHVGRRQREPQWFRCRCPAHRMRR